MTGELRSRAARARAAATAAASVIAVLVAALMAVLALGSPSSARAADVTSETVSVTPDVFAPAPTQTDPTNLWDSTPIPVVAAAAKAVQENAPLPTDILPTPAQVAAKLPDFNPDCAPTFGPGIEPPMVCRLGDSTSKNVVVVIGDSHAGRWVPALEKLGRAQGFAVVPLGKAGCQLNIYNTNSPEWPCLSWYQWAIAEDQALHPVATLVSFLVKTNLETPSTVPILQSILGQVTNGVYITDPPYQHQIPVDCIRRPRATMRTCSTTVPASYVPFMKDVAAMTSADHHPVIPTLQWFCADGICPMVIDHTLTLTDRSHMTLNYSRSLSEVLGLALDPILVHFGMEPDLAAAPVQAATRGTG